jgi:hypothetical protein
VLEISDTLKMRWSAKMTTKKNQQNNDHGYEPPPEAFGYDDDVTEEAVRYVQAKADKSMKNGNWKVIEGHKIAK